MVKSPPANSGNAGLIPGLGRPPGEGIGNPLQYYFFFFFLMAFLFFSFFFLYL